MNRQTTLYLSIAVSLFAVGGYTYKTAVRIAAPEQVQAASRAAYTIVMQDFYYGDQERKPVDYSATPKQGQTYLKARRSDGSTAEVAFREYRSPSDFAVALHKVISVPARTQAISSGPASPKSILRLSETELAAATSGPRDHTCLTHPELVVPTEYLGKGTHLGVAVEKHRVKTESANVEVWEAPDLDCAVIFLRGENSDVPGGAPRTATIRTAISIDRGEPQGWHF